MNEIHGSMEELNEPGLYEFRLKGHVDARWINWFEALSLTRENDGTTLLTVQVVDQSALHGLLRKVRDLGLPLVSVIQVEREKASES
ncbi:hypothetical protein [Cohnella caldifontis]|uniref:hypothetical protein n=1 Tax=Cohnella caldifontis TaxID=3027471 RepID=UPI0023EDB883|nr:hypothetical protein [Cohnella sp. YIM B05605]